MSAMQKFAWFNLIVIALTLVVVLASLPFLGKGALGGFGFLGFLGLGALFLRKKAGQVVADERDQLIQRRAWVLAQTAVWVAFVLAAALLSPLIYGAEGAIPVRIVQIGVYCALMFLYALASVAILVQYAGGTKNAE